MIMKFNNTFFVVLLGLPGTGKGTQALKLVENRGLSISPGELIRKKLNSQDEQNDIKKFENEINSGNLLSDDFIINLVANSLENVKIEKWEIFLLIFDGVPRTVEQAKMLDELLKMKFGKNIDCVLYLEVKRRLIIKRLTSRVICVNCGKVYSTVKSPILKCFCGSTEFIRRKDDERSVINRRLKSDRVNIMKIRKYYASGGTKCFRIDGNANPKAVYRRLKDIIFSSRI